MFLYVKGIEIMNRALLSTLLIALYCLNGLSQVPTIVTVGGNNPDFTTINEAIDQFTGWPPLSDPLVINLRDGTYFEDVHLTPINSSEINTIILQSESGNPEAVTIIHSGATFTLTIGDYTTVQNITVVGDVRLTDDEPQFHNSHVTGDLEIQSSSFAILKNSQIDGNVEISVSDYLIAESNVIHYDLNSFASDSCTFEGNTVEENVDLSGSDFNTLIGNQFLGQFGIFSGDSIGITGNSFYGPVEIVFSDYSWIINNNFYSSLQAPSHFREVSGNEFAGITQFRTATNSVVKNNIFRESAGINAGSYTSVSYNNFAFDSPTTELIYLGNETVTISYNTLPPILNSWSSALVTNNNYPSGQSYSDPYPLFIDPMYDSDLRTTNPQLIGTGILDTLVIYDIDSLLRPEPPTIGANEVCISSDTINVNCGDLTFLTLCGIPDNGIYSWTPASELDSPTSQNPVTQSSISQWYIANESTTGYTDSVYVNVEAFSANASGPLDPITCGQSGLISTSFFPTATYEWSSSSGTVVSTDQLHEISPTSTETYFLTVDHPICGTAQDSVLIQVEPWEVIASGPSNDVACGIEIYLSTANYHPNAIFEWSFSSGQIVSTEQSFHISPTSSETYYVTATLPGCSSSIDSMIVTVDSLPTASASVDWTDQNLIQFFNGSLCADAYQWDFGDSTFSSLEDPSHMFPDTGGTFIVTLIACNDFGCDTTELTLTLESIYSGIEGFSDEASFSLYPNPTTGDFTISYSGQPSPIEILVTDSQGRIVHSESRMSAQSMSVDLPELENGLYLVTLVDESIMQPRRLIISQ